MELVEVPVGRHGGTVIVPHVSQRLFRTLQNLDLTDRAVVNTVLAVTARLAESYAQSPDADPGRLSHLRRCLANDGYFLDQSGDPRAVIRELAALATARLTDASALRVELARLERGLDEDPGRDIGTAKRLVESTAKIVLTRCGEKYDKNASVPWLVDRAMDQLDLTAAGKPKAQSELLEHLTGLAKKVNTMRNQAGDGHGQATAVSGIDSRDSRLVVRAAIAWCAYLLDTLSDMPERRQNT
ncbi:abortive infection family protein [Thermomonospora catenispora]|uniref:abortive infection family protein n=1 Tax=Thermomonospora catenispora TaxID=2493090 RepID=UPI0019D65EF1|nr:abortive infection family protein [Thermomonospora catenispora]